MSPICTLVCDQFTDATVSRIAYMYVCISSAVGADYVVQRLRHCDQFVMMCVCVCVRMCMGGCLGVYNENS